METGESQAQQHHSDKPHTVLHEHSLLSFRNSLVYFKAKAASNENLHKVVVESKIRSFPKKYSQ